MKKLPLDLKVAILDADMQIATALKVIIEPVEGVDEVFVFTEINEARNALSENRINSFYIDIFTINAEDGVAFVELVRSEFPAVPICLFASSENLATMPGINSYWRQRFRHYFQLSKDHSITGLKVAAEETLLSLSLELQANLARYKLVNLKEQLSDSSTLKGFTKEERQNIVETVVAAEQALEAKGGDKRIAVNLIPGVDTSQMEVLVSRTLQEAGESLKLTRAVNLGILALGAILILVSFGIAMFTGKMEAIAFGGFGLAGVIASLITNPLKSISASAARMVQIQAAYFHFLSQVSLLSRDSETISVIQRSERLGDATEMTIKVLSE